MSRNYCFTSFNTDLDITKNFVNYYIYQKEKAPSTDRVHLQGYIEFNKVTTIKQAKQIIGDPAVHLEKRKGTQAQAIEYCSKKDTQVEPPIIYGVPAKQGKRNDIPKMDSITQVIEENPMFFIKHSKGIEKYFQLKEKPTLRLDIEVIVLIGKPGSGKTRYVYDNHSIETIYKLNTNSNGTLWFDGYIDQEVLLIDDFKGWIKYTELLTILDIYPYRCQLKGSYTYAKWTKVYITSNYPVEEWYNKNEFNMEALNRRIKNKISL